MEVMREVSRKEKTVTEYMVTVVEEICNKIRRLADSRIVGIAGCKAEKNDLGIQVGFVVYQSPD